MMKILFDLTVCQPHGKTKFHGAGEYGYIIFKELAKNECVIFPYYDTSRYIDEEVKNIIKEKNLKVIDANENALREVVDSYGVDVFYSPLFSNKYKQLYGVKTRCIVTIHGVRALEMNRDSKEWLYATGVRDILKAFIKKTSYFHYLHRKYKENYLDLFRSNTFEIVTVSNHSRYSIEYFYGNDMPKKIWVRYSPSSSIPNYHQIEAYSKDKYYLVISANRWLKNSYRAMSAFDKLISKGLMPEGRMVVVGLDPKTRVFNKIKNKQRFELKDYVSRETLESLYKGAYAFLYPSLNEGFGDPPVEAMKYGTPVITSSFGAISEICGDAVLYVNPYSVDEIATRILELEDQKVYNLYHKRSLDRHSLISRMQAESVQNLVKDILEEE